MTRQSPTLAELGESGFLQQLARWVPKPHAEVLGIGDDAAVMPVSRGSVFLTTDALVEGTHFRRTWFRPEEVGYKALAVNLSDAAAMGGQPRFAVVSLVLPGATTMRAVERLYRGMQKLARRAEVNIVGGNVAEGDSVSVTLSLMGSFPRSEPVLRSGAQPGDRVYVSGQPGLARLGYRLLEHRRPGRGRSPRRPDLWKDFGREAWEWRRELGRSVPGGAAALKRFLTPEHRLSLGRDLFLYRPTALIDVSDGLGSDLFHLLDGDGENPRGILLDPRRFPLSPSFRKLAEVLGERPRDAFLQGGEDYELLVTLPVDTAERLGDRVLLSGTPLTAIGEVVSGSGVVLGGEEQIRLPRSGFQHFRK